MDTSGQLEVFVTVGERMVYACMPLSRARGEREYSGLGEECTIHYTKYITYMVSFKPHNPTSKKCYHFNFKEEGSEGQRGWVIFPRSHSCKGEAKILI